MKRLRRQAKLAMRITTYCLTVLIAALCRPDVLDGARARVPGMVGSGSACRHYIGSDERRVESGPTRHAASTIVFRSSGHLFGSQIAYRARGFSGQVASHPAAAR